MYISTIFLFIVEVQLFKKGSLSISKFIFGAILTETNSAVHLETQSSDRRCTVEQITPVRHTDPQSEIDYILRPFNQKGKGGREINRK